jgi:MFS family permease
MPRAVWVLGIVSLLMDVSSEMVHSLLPLFLVTCLNASALSLGMIEGVAEATALITRAFSGVLSDMVGRRKPLALAGYALATLTKPMFAMAQSVSVVLAARFTDRIGKGIRGAPRDALIADITGEEIRGAAFGLRQSLDTVGAFVGPTLASVLMILFSNDIRRVYWVAFIPGLLAVLLLMLGVREPAGRHGRTGGRLMTVRALPLFGRTFWLVVLFGAVFTLARFSEAFLLLRAQDVHVPQAFIPLFLVMMNAVYALSAYPAGALSDRLGRTGMLMAGGALLIGADLVLAATQGPLMLALGVCMWGLHLGLTQGIFAALVVDTSPDDLRGSAFGIFNLAGGLAMLLASVLAGLLWQGIGPPATFLAGALFAAASLAGFALFFGPGRITGPGGGRDHRV